MTRDVGKGWYSYRIGQCVFRFVTLNKAVRHLYREAGGSLSWRECSRAVSGRR